VGIESSLSIAHQAVMPGRLKVVDAIDEARLVKTDYEVGRIAYASQVVDAGLAKCLSLSKPGVQELTLYSESVRQMMGLVIMEVPNANLLASKFVCAVWPNKLSAQPHSVPGLFDQLEEGGPNVIIATTQADGYSAEVERTFFLGQVPDPAKRPFEVCMEARALGYELIKPGAAAAEVDQAVLNLLKKRGYGQAILHRTGHGFGITGHEPPWIALGSNDILEKNMVVSIEPGIYLPDLGGFRHSDTVLITADGCLSLTQAPDQLEALTLAV
jgi:Xaa-Pro dipeptidase